MLRMLDIGLNDLSGVSPAILVEALARLERVKLYFTELTSLQLVEIYTLMAERKSDTLREVHIQGNNNVDSVPTQLRNKARENNLLDHLVHK